MADCWRSVQKGGAPNKLGVDFEMFSTEKDFFARQPVWKSCDYDDCKSHVGYPRDCGPNGPVDYQWHLFEGGDGRHASGDVAFYVNTCNNWELKHPISAGDLGDQLVLLILLGFGGYLLVWVPPSAPSLCPCRG